MRDLEGTSEIGDSHVDCMQTYATSQPGSSDVLIQGNRCEGIRAQCLMAEGPDDEGGSGEGESRDWLFDRNYCDAYAAAQSVALEDIQDVIDHEQRDGRRRATRRSRWARTPPARGAGTTGSGRATGGRSGSTTHGEDGYEGPPVE